MKISLFIPCFVDQFIPSRPGHGSRPAADRLRQSTFPRRKPAVGNPASIAAIGRTLALWPSDSSKSSAKLTQSFAPQAPAPRWSVFSIQNCSRIRPCLEKAASLGQRVFEFSEFLVKIAKVADVGATFPHRVAYHDACHALRELLSSRNHGSCSVTCGTWSLSRCPTVKNAAASGEHSPQNSR